MAAGAWYREGTVSVTNGSKNVAGVDTLWETQISEGDLFTLDGNHFYEVETVTSNTALVLKTAYQESTASAQSYAIIRNFTSSVNAKLAARLSDLLNRWHTREDEWYAWHNGEVDGEVTDPAGQPELGMYPFTDPDGSIVWIDCPAKMVELTFDAGEY